jgi:phosphate transport system substrate-binding protein
MRLCGLSSLAAALLVAGCGAADSGDSAERALTVRGSDTMVILAQSWAEAFMKAEPGTRVQVSGGGSGTGITALLEGTADVANASRAIEASELEAIADQRGAPPVVTEVAVDAIAIYVHRDNPVAALPLRTLERIFRGKVEDWSALGLEIGPVVLYSRENSSGTYAYFKEHVLDDEDLAAEAQTLPGTAAVINAVSKDEGGIGYGGIGYGAGVRVVPVLVDDIAVAPTLATARDGSYPLSRPLVMVTVGRPTGTAAGYIAFARSPAGQALVEKLGFFPLAQEAPP